MKGERKKGFDLREEMRKSRYMKLEEAIEKEFE